MKNRQGYAIPLSLCVAGVTLMLGLVAAEMSAGDLGVASAQYYRERALQMANLGLERGVANGAVGGVFNSGSQTNTHSEDCAQLTVYDNTLGTLPSDSGCPVQVPVGFQYWVSRGEAHSGTRVLASAKVGALVRYGAPLGSAGAQVRYLLSAQGNGPVSFLAQDADGAPLPDEVICSTLATGLPATIPPGLVKPVTLGQIGVFAGSVQIPKGTAPTDIVFFDPTPLPPKINHDGSPFNIPEYSPPAISNFVASFTVADGSNQPLPPAHYGTLTLPPTAVVQLNGTYHIDNLVLAPTGDAQPGAQLRVNNSASAKVYLNQLQSNGRPLALLNNQPASKFRLSMKPVAPPSARLDLAVLDQSSVAVVAPGHTLRLMSDASGVIKGSFCCDTLLLKFPPNTFNPRFIYDVSASQARSAKNGNGSSPKDPPTDTGTSDLSNSSNAGNAGNSGNTQNPSSQSGTSGTPKRPPELMILSRVTL